MKTSRKAEEDKNLTQQITIANALAQIERDKNQRKISLAKSKGEAAKLEQEQRNADRDYDLKVVELLQKNQRP